MYKVIIAGGREFDNYEQLKEACDYYLQNKTKEGIEIVSGGATGADALGERYAEERGYPITKFPADWGKHGRAAGPIRNKEMANYANALVAFWDGQSKGTKSMIELAREGWLDVRVEEY